MEALTERSSEEDLFLNGIIHLAKNATVMARAQARGNLINSKNRLLRRFTPRNDNALVPRFFDNGIIPFVLSGNTILFLAYNFQTLPPNWNLSRWTSRMLPPLGTNWYYSIQEFAICKESL
jgi:hypothetical protein